MTIHRSAAPVQPLTLAVEQAAVVLGASRSTAYELVRAGEIESIRLRRRIVVPVTHLSKRLGVTAADVWAVLSGDPSGPPTSRTAPSRTSHEPVELAAGHGESRLS